MTKLHHIVIHDGTHVCQVIENVEDIKVDHDKKVVEFDGGKLVGLDHEHFLIVDCDVPVREGQMLNGYLLRKDETDNFDGFDFFRKVKEFFTGE